jgi:cytochrome c3-like protein
VNFRKAPQQCESCHEDAHGGQFARGGVTRCAECHNSMKWRPSLFDHEKTIFALKGAHGNVPCRDCHTGFRLVSDKKVLFYRPTPTACAACHGSKTLAGGL